MMNLRTWSANWACLSRVRSDGVVTDAPAIGHYAQLLHSVESLSVQELIPQF